MYRVKTLPAFLSATGLLVPDEVYYLHPCRHLAPLLNSYRLTTRNTAHCRSTAGIRGCVIVTTDRSKPVNFVRISRLSGGQKNIKANSSLYL